MKPYDYVIKLKAHITALEAENKRLREALEKVVENGDGCCSDHVVCHPCRGSFDIALAALIKQQEVRVMSDNTINTATQNASNDDIIKRLSDLFKETDSDASPTIEDAILEIVYSREKIKMLNTEIKRLELEMIKQANEDNTALVKENKRLHSELLAAERKDWAADKGGRLG